MSAVPLLTCFTGADEYRRLAAVRETVAGLIAPDERDFNYTKLSARGLEGDRLIVAVETPPVFAPRRVVEVQDAELLTALAVQTLARALDAAAVRQDDSVAVLLVYGGDKKPPKDLASRAAIRDFPALKRRDALDWIRQYARTRHQQTLAYDVAELLCEAVGAEDAGRLAAEIDKLSSMTAGRAITVADVEFATGFSAAESPYAFYDCVGHRRYAEAVERGVRLLRNPEYPGVRVVIGLSLHLSNIGLARTRLDAGESRSAVETSLGGWFGKKYVEQAAAWTRPALDDALRALLDADIALKTGHDEGRTLALFLARALVAPARATAPT